MDSENLAQMMTEDGMYDEYYLYVTEVGLLCREGGLLYVGDEAAR